MTSRNSKLLTPQPCRYWGPHEEEALLDALKALRASGWKSDGGFKGGYMNKLETMLALKVPNAKIEARHIKSKIHVWKKDYGLVLGILGTSGGCGVSMDLETNMLILDLETMWAEYVKVYKDAAKLKGCSLPYFNSWVEIFGNDRAQGNEAVDVGDAFHDLVNDSNYKSSDGDPEFMLDSGQPSRLLVENDVFDDANSNTPPGPMESNTKSTALGVKRKRADIGGDVIESMMGKFLENTSTALSALTARLKPVDTPGREATPSEFDEKKMLFDAISEIDSLSVEQQLHATHMLALNNREMDAFWGMPTHVRKEFIRLLLLGTM